MDKEYVSIEVSRSIDALWMLQLPDGRSFAHIGPHDMRPAEFEKAKQRYLLTNPDPALIGIAGW